MTFYRLFTLHETKYETIRNEEFGGSGKELRDKLNVALLSATSIWRWRLLKKSTSNLRQLSWSFGQDLYTLHPGQKVEY
jgi:hypothetical protein